ncbi:hypothetical protein KY329_03340 [Candidatus Woesearchaeota archaeon]|nr:hypothetical protein [Candidatus Woesearchaeota archaeon]
MIDLDEAVVNALALFTKHRVPSVRINFKRPLIVGSGNAAVTGRILFHDKDAVFADESTYKEILESHKVDGAVLVSASGGKHAPGIAKELKKRRLTAVLLTCNPDALASKFVNKTFLFPRNTEPYTYNVSTYLGMILGMTKEKPKGILTCIKKLKIPKLSKYNAFTFIVPPKFELVASMLNTKFDELFGSMINGRVFTSEEIKHARTIVSSDKELFVGLGCSNRIWGKHRISIPLTPNFGMLMAVGYYIIGKVQKDHPPWFKKNIAAYCKFESKLFKENITPIVKGEY